MKMKQTLLLLAVAQGLTLGTESGAMLRAQELKQCEHVTLTATADAYTTCVSTDSRNYGKESYLKLICKHIIYLIISDIQYLLMIFARHLHNEDGNCF